jgi:hypothetical protein
MTDDVQAGQADAAQISMHALTPKMPAVAQEQFGQEVADISAAAFTTPAVLHDRGGISPDFRLDNEPSLMQQFDLAKRERRYTDAKHLQATMLAQQTDLEQQLALAEHENRLDDCIRLSDLIAAQTSYMPVLMTRPNLPQLPIQIEQIERRSSTPSGYPLGISEDTIRAGQIVHASDKLPVQSLLNMQDPSTDIMPNMQEVLILRWGAETQLYERDVAEAYLATADWHMDEAVQQYISDMLQWRTHTKNSDVSMATRYLRQWDFDISAAVAAWQRAHLAAGSVFGPVPMREYSGSGRQSGMLLLRHRDVPVSEYGAGPLRGYGDHGHPSGMPVIHNRVPLSLAQDAFTTVASPTVGPRGIVLGDTLPNVVALQIMARTRFASERLSPEERAECAREMARNFRPELVRDTFDLPPNARVAGLHRDFLLGICRHVEALRGGLPEREDLVLLWMMKHYAKEAAVSWKSSFDAAQQHAIPGRWIEYVIQALSKLYANPLAASMAREALDQFQWLPQTSVQVVQVAFAVLQNTHASAVEDT